MNRSSFQWIFAAAGVLLLAGALSAQQAQPAQGGQAAPQGQGRQGGAGGGRQGGGGGGFTNLTVLPANTPAPQVVAIMQAFETALGVDCSYCHVYQGRGNPANNMASDEKPAKKTARLMMLAARDFNAKLTPADLGKPANYDVTRVQCGTCHRGQAIPKYAAPAAAPAGAPAGGRQGGA